MAEEPKAPNRRRQADRSQAARTALLDAAVQCLAEDGWAATSTRSVAQRAGLSQGAQQHHFPTKLALVEGALEHVMRTQSGPALRVPLPQVSEREQIGLILDRIWEIHNLPLNRAVLELLVAARTEPEIAERVARTITDATNLTVVLCERLVPTVARTEGFRDFMLVTFAMIRGTLLAQFEGTSSALPSWPVMREYLLLILDTDSGLATRNTP